MKKILALAGHTDDVEIGCGGTLSRLTNEYDIKVVSFTWANEMVEGNIKEDYDRSMSILGVTDYECLDMPIRYLWSRRQDVLDYLWKLNKEEHYDLVFCPALADNHQDHHVVAKETQRMFKGSTILGYELPWNMTDVSLTTYVKLTKEQVDHKAEMVEAYFSQKGPRAGFMSKDFVFSLAKVRGLSCKAEYAEAFETIRRVV